MTQNMQIILAMSITVFMVRSVPFIFAKHISLPLFFRETLELLPPAILTVIVASGVLINEEATGLNIALDNHYLLACILTLIIALRVKNFLFVLILGYISYLILAKLIS